MRGVAFSPLPVSTSTVVCSGRIVPDRQQLGKRRGGLRAGRFHIDADARQIEHRRADLRLAQHHRAAARFAQCSQHLRQADRLRDRGALSDGGA